MDKTKEKIMESGQENFGLNLSKKSLLALFLILTICLLILFRNFSLQPTLLLKSFGKLSIDPEVAFKNNKPTFLEFYAEWCEVCKEMAPKVNLLKDEYEKDINFVFLNVDNPKWENYIRKFEVNGIPQVNLFDKTGNLKSTFIGKQEEKTIKEALSNLNCGIKSIDGIMNSDLSILNEVKNYKASPRSHG